MQYFLNKRNYFFHYSGNYTVLYHIMHEDCELLIIELNGQFEILWSANSLNDLFTTIKSIEFKEIYSKIGSPLVIRSSLCHNKKRKTINKFIYKGFSLKDISYRYVSDHEKLSIINASPDIEKLNNNTIDEFMVVAKKLFKQFHYNKNQIRNIFHDNSAIILLAKHNSCITGFLLMSFHKGECDFGFLEYIGVLEEYQNCGIAKKLILSCLYIAKSLGIMYSMLWVNEKNTKARSLYEKTGYQLDKNEVEISFIL